MLGIIINFAISS